MVLMVLGSVVLVLMGLWFCSYLRVLVEELTHEGGSAPGGCQDQDVGVAVGGASDAATAGP